MIGRLARIDPDTLGVIARTSSMQHKAKYLLIEPRNPSESTEVFNDYELAASLARDGNDVTFFLVQNGVFPAPQGS